MKRFNFSKAKKEKYEAKKEKYFDSLNEKLKILNGATSGSKNNNNKIDTSVSKNSKGNTLKPTIIKRSYSPSTNRNSGITDEITKNDIKDVDTMDGKGSFKSRFNIIGKRKENPEGSVINTFSRDLESVFEDMTKNQEEPKKKKNIKQTFANVKESLSDGFKNRFKKQKSFDNTKLNENLSKLRINMDQFEENKSIFKNINTGSSSNPGAKKNISNVSTKKKISGNGTIVKEKKKNRKEELPDYEVIPEIASINRKRAQSIKDAFKEIQDIRTGKSQAKEYVSEENIRIKTPDYYRKIRRRFGVAGAILGCLFITVFYTSIHGNYILAAGEEEKIAIAEFEQNRTPMNMMNIIAGNISDYTKKEIVTEEITLEYETKYMDNDQMPLGESRVIQTGSFGYKDRTVIRTYENENMIDEKVINEVLNEAPVDEVIEVGKSQFLADKKAHVNEDVYTLEEIPLHENASDDSSEKCTIYQYVPVRLLYVMDDHWCIVKVDGIEGYVDGNYITTEEATPGILEKVRVQRLMLSLDIDMPLNRPSGFTESDFVKVLSNNDDDENHIFSDNARLFYNIENRYNINGIFLAAIGIHESNWGRSTIAQRKKNLFGYGAYDDTPFASAYTFDSYEYGIELVAKVLVKYYLNEEGTPIYDGETAAATYYNGPTTNGVGQRYASDPEWGNKVYSVMEYLYNRVK